MSTVKAAFGRGVELVNLDKGTPIPDRFVLQLPDELTPTHVTDGFCQAMVFEHVLDVQTLDTDRLVLTDQLCRELLLRITATITDTSVDPSHLEPSFGAVLTALLFLGETTLSTCQFLLILVEELRIAVGLSIGGDHHRLQAQVKPDLFVDHRPERDVLLDQDGHEVASGGILAHRHRRRLTSLGQGARPVDVQRSLHLGEGEGLPIPFEGRADVRSGLIAMPFLEGGILGAPFKEMAEGAVKMPERLLERNRRHVIQPAMIILLFEEGEAGRGFMIAQALLLFVVGISTQSQREIVDVTSTAKGVSKQSCLLRRRITSVLIGSWLFHTLHDNTYHLESQPFAPFICRLQVGRPLARFYSLRLTISNS